MCVFAFALVLSMPLCVLPLQFKCHPSFPTPSILAFYNPGAHRAEALIEPTRPLIVALQIILVAIVCQGRV